MPRMLDWGDSCISHPFFTLFVTFMHLEELPADDPWFARLRGAYLEPWGTASELRGTFDLALRLGAFAHVFKELRVFDAIPAAARSQFAPDFGALLARCVAMAE